MRIFTVLKCKKYMVYLGSVFIIAAVTLGLFHVVSGMMEARVDRSTAMQVSKPIAEQVIPATSPDFFTEYRLERDKIRSERTDLLREAIKNSTNDEARQKAQDNILKIIAEKQKETEMENLIKAKGFADALVFIRENSVSAVIKTTSLSREDVLMVADIISRVCGIKSEDITISAKP